MAERGVLVGRQEMLASVSACSLQWNSVALNSVCNVTVVSLSSSGCICQDAVQGKGHPRGMHTSLLPVKKHNPLGYLFLFYTSQMGCLKTIGVVLKSCLGKISCFTPLKASCNLLDGFLKCGLEQKFKTQVCCIPKKKCLLNCI